MRARRARRARNARANRGAASARPWPIAPRAGHLRAFFHVAHSRAEERGEAAHVRGRAGGPHNDLRPGIERADGLDIFRHDLRHRPHLRVSQVRTAADEIGPRSGQDRPRFGSVRPSSRRPARPAPAPAACSIRLCGFIAGGSRIGCAAAPPRKIGTALSATRTCSSMTRSFVYPR